MQPAGGDGAADESIDPPARKERGPQDDNAVFNALIAAGPQYILRLIGQVITISLETVEIVRKMPPLGLPAAT